MYKINLPIKENYHDFVLKYKNIARGEMVYKLLFNDGCFYIGCTENLASRMYNHVSMQDSNNCKNLSKKHKRMIKAIYNLETVSFEVIGNRISDECQFILEAKKDDKCLNMANGMGSRY